MSCIYRDASWMKQILIDDLNHGVICELSQKECIKSVGICSKV